MCDTAGGVLAAVPRDGPAADLARAALRRAAEQYGAHLERSLDEELDGPINRLPGMYSPRFEDVVPSFSVERYHVPLGTEQEFADEVRRQYLDVVIGHPNYLDSVGDSWRRLVVSPNSRLHPANVPDPVSAPFTFDSSHDQHLVALGLDQPTLSPPSPVIVAVLDNGFDQSYWTGSSNPPAINTGADLVPSDQGSSGHGTLVAALVKEGAPAAKVVPIRMAGAESTEYDALHALVRAVQIDATVMTLSYRQVLGTDKRCGNCGMVRQAARSEVMERMIEWASTAGDRQRTLLAAAGNDGADCVARPARSPAAVPVTALDKTGTALASFANWDASGRLPVMALPGEQVAVNTKTQQHYEGTSFATGYAAALCAEGIMRSGLSALDVTDGLRQQATAMVKNAAVVSL